MIKYGDTILNLEEARLNAWVNRYLSPEEMRVASQQNDFHINTRSDIPYPNFAFRDSIRFNELYVPSGASRFSIVHAVTTRDRVNAIVTEIGKTYSSLTLEFSAEGNNSSVKEYESVKIDGYMLPPHPLSFNGAERKTGPASPPTVWMVPIVDDRYFWQWKHCGAIEDETFNDLQDVIDYLETQLGTTIIVRYADKFGDDLSQFPVPEVAGLNYANAAIVLDAFTAPLGMFLTPNILTAGTYDLWGVDAAREAYRDRLDDAKVYGESGTGAAARTDDPLQIITGGDFWGRKDDSSGLLSSDAHATVRPEKVSVIFLDGTRTEYQTSALDTRDTQFDSVPDSHRIIRVPVQSEDATYSEAVAAAFAKRFRYQYDWNFAGIRPWSMTSLDDCVIYSERFIPPDEYEVFTRAISHAHNFASEIGGGTGGACDFIKFTITAVNVDCTQATVTIDHVPCGCSTVPEDVNGSVTVHDVDCQFDGHSAASLIGLQGDAKYMTPYGMSACKWVVTALCCDDDTCA